MVVLLGIYIKPDAYSEVLWGNSLEQQGTAGNNYEKFAGEKILLSTQGEEIQGDFGDLKLTPMIIEPTEDFITDQTYLNDLYEMLDSSSKWIFKDTGLVEIRSLFLKAGLDKVTCDELIANTTAITDGKGFITTPPDSVLWRITAQNRAILYPLIGKYSDNIMYSQPVYYGSLNSWEWFYSSGLKKEVTEKLLKLVYVEDGISYLSDIHLILPLLNKDVDRIKLLQTLFRTRTFDVKLQIKEGQDISKIVDYWSPFGGRDMIEPMLERTSNTPGGGEINISKLLPRIPQSRVNTYSGFEEYQKDYKDCHWTTLNFFNKEADESYYNSEDLLSAINAISEPAENSIPGFGDLITIFNGNNELTHSCTYIADNLVLTKNGMGNLKPFVITYLDKIVPLYGEKTVFNTRTVGDTHSVNLEDVE